MNETVLIIEDNYAIFKILEVYLEKAGFKIISSSNGSEGIEKAKKDEPSIIILDSFLPDIDGLEVCKNLKSDDMTQHIPVIFMSNFDSADDHYRAINAGADAYILKYNTMPDRLVELITSILTGEQKENMRISSGSSVELEHKKGELLVEAGFITAGQQEKAEAQCDSMTLPQALIDTGAIKGERKDQIMELFYGADYVDLSKYSLDEEAVNLVKKSFVEFFSALPIRFDGEKVLVAMADPLDVEIEEDLRVRLNRPVKILYAPSEAIKKAVRAFYG
jgi:DNA-binding response OmpR family regulator